MNVSRIIEDNTKQVDAAKPKRDMPPLEWVQVHEAKGPGCSAQVFAASNGRYTLYRIRMSGDRGAGIGVRIQGGDFATVSRVSDGMHAIGTALQLAWLSAVDWIDGQLKIEHDKRNEERAIRETSGGPAHRKTGKTDRDREKRKGSR